MSPPFAEWIKTIIYKRIQGNKQSVFKKQGTSAPYCISQITVTALISHYFNFCNKNVSVWEFELVTARLGTWDRNRDTACRKKLDSILLAQQWRAGVFVGVDYFSFPLDSVDVIYVGFA